MENTYDLSRYEAVVGRYLAIQDITTGNPEKEYIVRYRGQLYAEDTETAYDQLAEQLKPMGVTPLFRWDDDRHAVYLVPGKPKPKESNPMVNLVMFLLTLVTVTLAGILNSGEALDNLPANPLNAAGILIRAGLPFTVSLLAILLTHEFGHYLMSRHYGVHATLPYFIPFPSIFGTMGAVIVMKESPKNRRQLLDIGLAGPLAGLVVSIIVVLIGLSLSKLDPLPTNITEATGHILEGNSILYLLLKFSVFRQLLPAPVDYGNTPQWLYWLRFLFTGQPFPLGGTDVMLHPVAFAGWIGLFVTALNLLPAGQLDGGHAVYVLIGKKKAARLLPFLLGALVLMGFFWSGWWLWAAMIYFFGRTYDDPLDQITPLDGRRRALAVLGIIVFILVFMPVPLTAF